MWFLPLLVVSAIAALFASRSSRGSAPPSRQLAAGPPVPRALPGPISVLGEILRVGQAPPPRVILCAIAEAQSIGRNDLASDIVLAFVAPVVHHHQRSRVRSARPVHAQYERGSCAPARSPRYAAESAYNVPAAPPPFEEAAYGAPGASPFGGTSSSPPPADPLATAAAAPEAPTFAPTIAESSEDEISALLNSDPRRFMEMVSRSGTFPSAVQPQGPLAAPAPSATSFSAPSSAPIAQPTRLPPEAVAQMQEAAGLPEAADRTRSLAPGSPIPGVSDSAWRDFVVRLERESPQFSSSRHVGQYRHRRERLAELGIDPRAIAGSAQAQRSALDTDLSDAHRHGVAGEMFAQHLGRPIALPGSEGTETISLSGVLGVIQCAGLEGAAGWLERSNDRKRYPHTTQAFTRTNGVF